MRLSKLTLTAFALLLVSAALSFGVASAAVRTDDPEADPTDCYLADDDVHDSVQCGDGDDQVQLGKGDDDVSLGAGDDEADGGDGDDVLHGGPGKDRLPGGARQQNGFRGARGGKTRR